VVRTGIKTYNHSAPSVPPETLPPAIPVVVDSPECVGDVPFDSDEDECVDYGGQSSESDEEEQAGDVPFEPDEEEVVDYEGPSSAYDEKKRGKFGAGARDLAAREVDGMNQDSDEQQMRAEFLALEQDWQKEGNVEKKRRLYKEVENAEVTYANRFHIYDDLRTGKQSMVNFAKDKTRNRMRTRLKNNRCIGFPEMGRAIPRKRKRASRVRVDPESRQTMSWEMFCAKNSPADDLPKQWRTLPKLQPKAKQRIWQRDCDFMGGMCCMVSRLL